MDQNLNHTNLTANILIDTFEIWIQKSIEDWISAASGDSYNVTETEGDHETVSALEDLTGLGYYTENREGKPAEIYHPQKNRILLTRRRNYKL